MSLLSVRDLRFGYGDRPVLAGVSFDVSAGEFLGVLGPNGAGKSTLLRLALGILAADAGEVRLGGDPVGTLARDAIARRAAFLPQGVEARFAFSVREVVAMGRTPHLGRFRPEGPADREAVRRALERTDAAALAERPVTELSGGERQRVFLARALAQEAGLLVLDEPNANLDLLHAFQLVDLVHAHARGGGAALAALHDLTLAARVCDRVLVLKDGRAAALGPPREVLTADLLASVFGVRARILAGDPFAIVVDGPA